MTNLGRFIISLVVLIILAIIALAYFTHSGAPVGQTGNATTTVQTYGMSEYADPSYGFTFWYPSSLTVTASAPNSSTNFPGGVDVERLDIGPLGGIYISVVQSASSTITDEPNGHAAPLAQTEYFYDASAEQWMVAYPEGTNTGLPGATTTADVSKTTVAGLPMLPSSARFDTTIIPLSASQFLTATTIPSSTTEFIVVQDGGASSFTSELAATVAPLGVSVDPSALSSALQAESAAYANQ